MSKVLEIGLQTTERIGNYRVERQLGPTGAGILIEAQHLVLPRKAIVKVVHPAFAGVQAHVVQTLREACILEAIAHPGVPIVYESGVLKDRRPWFAFEAISGQTLEEMLADGPLSVAAVAGILRDLAEVLEHVHRRGIIHRGLRPDRVVVTSERRYPLCIPDWSEAMAHDAAPHFRPAMPVGTGRYVAPELVRQGSGVHELVDDRVDMFALGAIGHRALRGNAPRELAALIDSLLSADRLERPSASEARAELECLIHSLPAAPARWQSTAQGTPVDILAFEQPRRLARWTPEIQLCEATDIDLIPFDEAVAQ